MNDLFQTHLSEIYILIISIINYIIKRSLSSNNFQLVNVKSTVQWENNGKWKTEENCIFLHFWYLQWTQSIFTTNFSTDCSQKKCIFLSCRLTKRSSCQSAKSFQYFQALFTRTHFSIMKNLKWQKISICKWEIFLSYEGINSIKTNLR